MDEKLALKKRIALFRENVSKTRDIDKLTINQYRSLETEFKKLCPEMPFEHEPVTQPTITQYFIDNAEADFERKKRQIMFRLEHMISFFPDESNKNQFPFISIGSINAENFNQIINSLNIDNSVKQTINHNINELREELEKPERNKEKIKEKILNLLRYDLPKEVLLWIIRSLLSS